MNFDNVEIKPQKLYIAFTKNSSNFVDIEIQKKALKIYINLQAGMLEDSKKLARDVSSIGTWGNGDYLIKIENDNEFEYIMSLIKQSYLAK